MNKSGNNSTAAAAEGKGLKKDKGAEAAEEKLQRILRSELDDSKEKDLSEAIQECKAAGMVAKSSLLLAAAERELAIIRARISKINSFSPSSDVNILLDDIQLSFKEQPNWFDKGNDLEKMALRGLMSQSCGSLETTINRAKGVNRKGKLDGDISDAQRRLQELKVAEEVKQPILNMDKKMLREILMAQPPTCVEAVMKATLLLLGSRAKELKNWGLIKSLLSKTGEDSLENRVKQFRLTHLTTQMVEAARAELTPHTESDVKAASPAAHIFYIWCKDVLREVRPSATLVCL